MADVKIKLTNPKPELQRLFTTNGVGPVYLDVDDEFNLRLSKVMEELTEANKIRQQGALSQSLPATPRNRLILERYAAHVLERQTGTLPVEVTHRGRPVPVDRLVVVEWADRNNRIEIELFGPSWIIDLEEIPLNTIDNLGTFDYTKLNVEATWSDTTALAVAAVADYGGWLTPGDVTRQDLRIWFNLFKLMSAALCQAGWIFESPYYEGTAGASLYGYLSGEKWYSYEDKNNQFRVDTNVDPLRMLSGAPNINFDEISDPFDLYNTGGINPATYAYPPAGPDNEFRIRITNMTITLKPHPTGSSGQFFMVVTRSFPGFQFLRIITRDGQPDRDVTFTINETITDHNCTGGTSYTFLFGYQEPDNSPLDWEIEAQEIAFIPDPPYLEPDDTIELKDLLSDEITAADLYKAMSHICNGKTKTDFVGKKVVLYPAFDHVQNEESVHGFFERNQPPIVMTKKVEPDSRLVKYNRKDQNRFIKLTFADSNDSYINDAAFFPQLFDRTVDLGEGIAKTTEIKNELFEPSNERAVDPALVGSTTADGLTLIHLWDNTDGTPSKEIGPRIAHHYGLIEQEDPTTAPAPRDWQWESATRTSFGYLSQTGEATLITSVDRVPVAFSEYGEDLYRLHYQRWIGEIYSALDIEFLIFLKYLDYNQIDFRRPIGIFYRETFLLFQAIAIKDFDLTERISTPVEVKLLEC